MWVYFKIDPDVVQSFLPLLLSLIFLILFFKEN